MIATNFAIQLIGQHEEEKMFDLAGQNFLSSSEGVKYTAYKDSVGVWTIGRGITYYEDGSRVKQGDVISKEREHRLFLNTVKGYVDAVNRLVTANLTQNQFNALVSLCYNIGIQNFSGSRVLKLVNKNPSDPNIRNAIASWNKGRIKGRLVVLKGLVNRRQKEADLYFSTVKR